MILSLNKNVSSQQQLIRNEGFIGFVSLVPVDKVSNWGYVHSHKILHVSYLQTLAVMLKTNNRHN